MARTRHRSRKHSTRPKPKNLARGVFNAAEGGYGFVKTQEGEFFIPRSKTHDAFDGDLVEITPSGPKGGRAPKHAGGATKRRDEARIVRIIEHKHAEIVGRYEVAEPFGIVVPEDPRIDHDIFTRISDWPGIEDGALVKVGILEYPTRRNAAFGKVTEVLGERDANALLLDRIVSRYDLETRFSDGALDEAESKKLDVASALASGYRDIRKRYTFTIDPADAKDFDDALSMERIADDEYRLGVHIADVSAYVEWASAVDLAARRRATSVYLPDRVIPMIPYSLSDELCSLQPGQDRLSMTVDIFMDSNAKLLDYDIYPAVIHSDLRLSYDEAQKILDDLPEDFWKEASAPADAAKPLTHSADWRLAMCAHLADARLGYRESQGGINFTTKEAKVRLDEDGNAIGIDVRERNDATGLIEEAMIFANEVVAMHLAQHDLPCAYRVHEAPAADSLTALVPVLQQFKWFDHEMTTLLPTGNPHIIQSILDAANGRAEQDMVTMLMLRAMMRAVYSPENIGHYGLGLRYYCHFTSPIRRYPDLIVHRMLKHALGFPQPDFKGQTKSLKWLCEHSSEMERNAEAASFDAQNAKIVEYMAQFEGREFDAVISGVVAYGLYVRLDNCAEGLVPVRTLGDEYFVFDE